MSAITFFCSLTRSIKLFSLLLLGGFFCGEYALASDADDLKKGVRAYQNGDYRVALSYIRPLAERNNEEAQMLLGDMYQRGLGVKYNRLESIKWSKLAAIKGNAVALYNLAMQYQLGNAGYNKSEVESLLWQSALQGYAPAQNLLAVIYESGNANRRYLSDDMYCIAALNGNRNARVSLSRRGLSIRSCKRKGLSIRALADDVSERRQKELGAEFLVGETELKDEEGSEPENSTKEAEANRVAETERIGQLELERTAQEAEAKRLAAEKRRKQEQELPIIRKIQSLLVESRYLAGSADGVMGIKSRAALETFYIDAGLDLPDRFDPKTILDSMSQRILEAGKSCGLGASGGDWAVCLSVSN